MNEFLKSLFGKSASTAPAPAVGTATEEQLLLKALADIQSSPVDPAGLQALVADCTALEAKDALGRTALILAAGAGLFDIVAQLIKAGADVNARDNNGYTPLISCAGENNSCKIAALLISNATDVNAEAHGETAIAQAARRGDTDLIELLLQEPAVLENTDALNEACERLIENKYHFYGEGMGNAAWACENMNDRIAAIVRAPEEAREKNIILAKRQKEAEQRDFAIKASSDVSVKAETPLVPRVRFKKTRSLSSKGST